MTATIEERAQRYDLQAFVTVDTMPHIMKRLTNLARSGRRMTIVSRYIHHGQDGIDDRAPEVVTGLVVDTNSRNGGVNGWSQSAPEGSGISVMCAPGLHSWGVATYASEGDEAEAKKRWDERGKRMGRRGEVTFIEIIGGQHKDSYGSRDRVTYTRYNEDGVGMQTVVVFDTPERSEEFAAEAAVIDRVALAVDAIEEDPRRLVVDGDLLRRLAGRVRYSWKHVDEVEVEGEAVGADGRRLP